MHPPDHHNHLQVCELAKLACSSSDIALNTFLEPLFAKADSKKDNIALPVIWNLIVNFSLVGPVEVEHVVLI